MKLMNMKKRFWAMDLQLFAEGGDGEVDESGDDEDDPDEEEGPEDDPDEKKFSQKDMDEAVKKRLAREKRRWMRERQKNRERETSKDGSNGAEKAGEESVEDPEKQEAISKASRLEVKVACYEAGVAKDAVDDVAALAHAYMEQDESLDLEDAIEKVVKKYPQFKAQKNEDPEEKDPNKGKAWGERHRRGRTTVSGVEAAFLKKNPGLKI